MFFGVPLPEWVDGGFAVASIGTKSAFWALSNVPFQMLQNELELTEKSKGSLVSLERLLSDNLIYGIILIDSYSVSNKRAEDL